MATENLPECTRCFGKNWIDLGIVKEDPYEEHLYQCGGGTKYTDPNDMKMGCGRVIRAFPEEMNKGGVI